MRKLLPVLAVVVAVGCLGNFFWFMSESGRLGGDAGSGYVRDGQYFVGNHGSYTQVTREQWEWSQVHAQSILVTHPTGMLAMAYLLFGFVFPAMAGVKRGAEAEQRLRQVQTSGAPLATARTGGQVGGMRASLGLLSVTVHPGGLIVKPPLMGAVTVLPAEVLALAVVRSRFGPPAVQVQTPADLPNVQLITPPDSDLGRALERISGHRFDEGVPAAPMLMPEPIPSIIKWVMTGGSLLTWVFVAYVAAAISQGERLFDPWFLAIAVMIALVNSRNALRYWR